MTYLVSVIQHISEVTAIKIDTCVNQSGSRDLSKLSPSFSLSQSEAVQDLNELQLLNNNTFRFQFQFQLAGLVAIYSNRTKVFEILTIFHHN